MQIQTFLFILCGVLSIKGAPFNSESSVDILKFHEVHQQHESDIKNNTSNSDETFKFGSPDVDESEITDASILSEEEYEEDHGNKHGNNHGHESNYASNQFPNHHHEHGESRPANQIGPVEVSLRNVASASAIASEELFLEMAALSTQTSAMIKTKSELLTSNAMNAVFHSLNLAETEIKRSQECGRQYVESFNSILSQINSGLNSCIYNLTIVDEGFRNQSTQILASISKVADDIKILPQSCELDKSFTLGTFCIINNLAEANSRVVMDVKNIKFINFVANKALSTATNSIVACQKNLVGAAVKKLEKLSNEVILKCNDNEQQQVQYQNNEM